MTLEIIAELSGAHGGSLDNAIELIEAAKTAGATGVKFQAFDPERLAKRRKDHQRLSFDYAADELLALYHQTHTPQHWFPELIAKAGELGLTWHASVFDPADVAFLETLNCPRYKVASFEAQAIDIVNAARETEKPIILSVNQNESVDAALCNFTGLDKVTVLHATGYGVASTKAHLKRLPLTPWYPSWGLSDHTTSPLASQIAAALGARMIEWHIRLPDVSTPDDAFAWTPDQFAERVARVCEIEEAMNG